MSIFSRPAAVRGLCALPLAVLIAAAPAMAQLDGETVVTAHDTVQKTTTRTMRVSVRDLDLGSARDQGRFEARVMAAADTVCADEAGTVWNKFAGSDYDRCHTDAVASAITRLPVGSQSGRD